MYVGVDIGTTGAKAVVVDEGWRVLGEHTEEYPTHYLPASGAEQDPDDWWGATARSIAAAIASCGAAPGAIAGVGVSSQAPSVVLLDAEDRPLRPALLWMDRRGQSECTRHAAAGEGVLARTGNRLDAYYAGPALSWLLRTEPGLRHSTRSLLMANGYAVHRLTGVHSCDTGHAGLTLMADLHTGAWVPELADLWSVSPNWLPDPQEPTTVVGQVHAEAARATGLLEGTPVVAGAVDGVTASLAGGVAVDGDMCEMTGQSTVVNAALPIERFPESWDGTLSVMPYPVPGHHLVYGSMVASGGILRWFRDQLGLPSEGAGAAAFAALDDLAASSEPGAGGLVLLPYFLGERSPIWDPDARGAIVGLSMGTQRADLVRAIYEGTAYGLAHNMEVMAAAGITPSTLRSVGGGSLGQTWNQIKADVTGLPIELPGSAQGAPVGSALLAAAGVGQVSDLGSEVRARTTPDRRFEPDPDRYAAYRRRYAAYRRLYPALDEVHTLLAELRAEGAELRAGGASTA